MSRRKVNFDEDKVYELYMSGKSYKEMGEILKANPNTVSSFICSCRKKDPTKWPNRHQPAYIDPSENEPKTPVKLEATYKREPDPPRQKSKVHRYTLPPEEVARIFARAAEKYADEPRKTVIELRSNRGKRKGIV